MKKFLAFVMAASMALSLAACGGSFPRTPPSTTTGGTPEAPSSPRTSRRQNHVALRTHVGKIQDQSLNP